jgi:DNA polymerase elongation subunit (family B)
LAEFNNTLKKPLKIEQEKVYSKLFISSKKKRRFGLIEGKIEIKGYTSVRRDTPQLIKTIEQTIFNIMIEKSNFEDDLLNYISSINIKSYDTKLLSITKTLKGKKEYTSQNVPHLFLALKLVNSGVLENISSGDKIIYVYIENESSDQMKDRIATFDMINKFNLKIDYCKYRQDVISMIKQIMEDIVSAEFLDKLIGSLKSE